MTPAPKSRVPKGRIIEEPPSLPNSTTEDSTPADLSKVQSSGSDGRKPSSGLVPPLGPRFTLRNNPQGPGQYIVKRGTEEIREHLKHLGPSNLASRPRQTRYQNVKIKAPGVSPSRSGLTDSESRNSAEQHRRPSEVANGSARGSRLLHSPTFTAKDGVQAVRQGYGTIESDSTPTIEPQDGYQEQDKKTKQAATESQHENDATWPLLSPHQTPNRSHTNSVQSFQSRSSETRKNGSLKPGPARSGSITEQVIDLNGIRKVILQTTSSSSSESERGGTSKSIRHQKSNEHAIESEREDGESANTAKKRRRRRKKKKRGDDPENSPLLPT